MILETLMACKRTNCLVLAPSALDRHWLDKHKDRYTFFWATNDILIFDEGGGNDNAESLYNFDAVQFVQNCVQMVKDNGISIVVGTSDYSSLLASAVCEETGLPGTSVESQLLCYHKYYTLD